MNYKKLTILLFVLAVALRLISFGSLPNGINRDEAALGYNAYSILKTGKDEHGVKLPTQFESFGDWKKPVYIYLSTIPIKLFGLSEGSTRLTSLIFSILLIFTISEITALIFKDNQSLKYSSLLVVLLFALNPWHFHLSRIALEAMVALSLFSAGVYFQLKNKHLLAGLLFIISLYTYHSALIIIPLWLIIFTIKEFKTLKSNKQFLVSSVLILFVLSILFNNTFFSSEKAKASGLVIFDLTIPQQLSIMEKRTHPLSILIHNKYLYIGKNFFLNYIQTFSYSFLISQGGINPSYNIEGFGNFYFIEILFCIIGATVLLKTKSKYKWLTFAWLLIAPIPAAITHEATHSVRAIFLIPPVLILSAVGLSHLLVGSKLQKNLSKIGLVILTISAYSFFENYFTNYQTQSQPIYHGYMKQISQDMHSEILSQKYNQLVVEFYHESPYIFYAFYNQLDPKIFLSSVEFYPPDFEGFVHVKNLAGIRYESVDEEEITSFHLPTENNLVFSKPNDTESWIKPHQVWDNLKGEPIIISWEENQL